MQKDDCIFCKIISGEIDTKFDYETDNLVVFKDIHPSAPVHFLIVPKEHYGSFIDTPDNVILEIRNLAKTIKDDRVDVGFRLVTNYGDSAMIPHMHVHYLAGIKKERKV